MKKSLLTTTFLFIFLCSYAQKKHLDKIIEIELSEYFPILPFEKKWSEIMTYYREDTNYIPDSIAGKTDTTSLYLRGIHKTFNPFSFIPKTGILVCFREEEEYIAYHITALLDSSLASRKTGDKEVEDIDKKIRKFFSFRSVQKSGKKERVPYKSYDYRIDPLSSWSFNVASSYIIDPYYTGYFVLVQLILLKEKASKK